MDISSGDSGSWEFMGGDRVLVRNMYHSIMWSQHIGVNPSNIKVPCSLAICLGTCSGTVIIA